MNARNDELHRSILKPCPRSAKGRLRHRILCCNCEELHVQRGQEGLEPGFRCALHERPLSPSCELL